MARAAWARTRPHTQSPTKKARSQGASAPCASAARIPTLIKARSRRGASGSPHEVAQWRARRGVRVDGAVRLGSRVDADAAELSPFCANAPCTLRAPSPARTSCADLRALAALPRGRPPALFTPLRSGCGAWGSGSAGIGRTDIWRAPPRGGLRPGGTDDWTLPLTPVTPGPPPRKACQPFDLSSDRMAEARPPHVGPPDPRRA